jgi:16S rRNA C1402 N4-methylase RsmH
MSKKFDSVIKKYIQEQTFNTSAPINTSAFKTLTMPVNSEVKKLADVLSKLLPQLNNDISSINLNDENSINTFLVDLSKKNPEVYNKVVKELNDDTSNSQSQNKQPEASTNTPTQQQKTNTSTSYTTQAPKA